MKVDHERMGVAFRYISIKMNVAIMWVIPYLLRSLKHFEYHLTHV